MSRREFLRTLGIGAAALGVGAARAADSAKPNVLLVLTDDQGYGDLSCHGNPVLKTPNLDKLHTESVRFTDFHVAPMCTPSRGELMTGMQAFRNGAVFVCQGKSMFRRGIPSMADMFRADGYATGHFGKWHLGSVRKGSPVNPGASGFDEWLSAPNFFDNNPILSREGVAVQTHGESSMVTADAAIEFIRKHAKGDKPFLAVVWFGSPHAPHQAVEQDRKLYADQPKRKQHFLGEITGMDRAFGKLRGALKALGIRDHTLLWYCSDNGGLAGLGATGGRGHKGHVYEGGLRVPAILEWPARLPTPRVTAVPCNTSDIYPTLLDLVGASMPHQPPLDGVSLVPLLDGKMTSRPKPMGFWNHPAGGIGTPSKQWMSELLAAQKAGKQSDKTERLRLDAGKIKQQYPEDAFPGHAAWLDWPWKLHRIHGKSGPVKLELYDLARDPSARTNLARQQADRAKALRAALEEWLASVARSLNGKDYPKT